MCKSQELQEVAAMNCVLVIAILEMNDSFTKPLLGSIGAKVIDVFFLLCIRQMSIHYMQLEIGRSALESPLRRLVMLLSRY